MCYGGGVRERHVPRRRIRPALGSRKKIAGWITYCGHIDCTGPHKCRACRATYMRAWRKWKRSVAEMAGAGRKSPRGTVKLAPATKHGGAT